MNESNVGLLLPFDEVRAAVFGALMRRWMAVRCAHPEEQVALASKRCEWTLLCDSYRADLTRVAMVTRTSAFGDDQFFTGRGFVSIVNDAEPEILLPCGAYVRVQFCILEEYPDLLSVHRIR